MRDFNHFKSLIDEARATLSTAHHRQLLVISGSADFCYAATHFLFEREGCCILSQSDELTDATWPEHLHQILGQEWPIAIYDGYSGVIPNKLSALSGTVKAGGLLVLLLPELEQLGNFRDPALEKWCSAECDIAQSHFLLRLAAKLTDTNQWRLSEQYGVHLPQCTKAQTPVFPDFSQQNSAIEQIVHALKTKRTLPVVLSADRGRGKSSSLGLIAKAMPNKTFILCAPHRHATAPTFRHLGASEDTLNDLVQYKNLQFLPPDQILRERPKCDVLFVDEAAAIPVPMLLDLLKQYPCSVFSSTLIGYEGNGRGYTLKFLKKLRKLAPQCLSIHLDNPLRFAAADPLEQRINQLFALDCHYEDVVDVDHVEFATIESTLLINDDHLLQEIFSLFVLSHYQTSVNDLRQLLDTPNQSVYVLRAKGKIIAACLVAIEGGLSSELSSAIVEGSRRPRGHLLAQQLAQLSQNPDWCTQRLARIVRIAVAPGIQYAGLGSQLLHEIEQCLAADIAFIGSSFGANHELLSFWFKNQFRIVKLGYKLDKVSGEHAALVLKARQLALDNHVITLSQAFYRQLPYQLLTYFKLLDAQLVLSLWAESDNILPKKLEKTVFLPITRRSMAELQPVIWQWLIDHPTSLALLCASQQVRIIRYVLQGWLLSESLNDLPKLSKKQIEQELNDVVQIFISNTE